MSGESAAVSEESAQRVMSVEQWTKDVHRYVGTHLIFFSLKPFDPTFLMRSDMLIPWSILHCEMVFRT